MAEHYEFTLALPDRGEVLLTDEDVRSPYLLGMGIYEAGESCEAGAAYIDLTVDEAVALRDELTRHIETRGPLVVKLIADEAVRPVHFHGSRACKEVHFGG